MTTVRIALAEPRQDLGNRIFMTRGFLVVLGDDAGRRALPFFPRGHTSGVSLSGPRCRSCSAAATSFRQWYW